MEIVFLQILVKIGTCNTGTGECECTNKADTFPCNDGNYCTTGDQCSGGTCSGSPRNCVDSDACTTDSCSEEDDICINEPITSCINGDGCCPSGCEGSDDDCQTQGTPISSCGDLTIEGETYLLTEDLYKTSGYCFVMRANDIILDCHYVYGVYTYFGKDNNIETNTFSNLYRGVHNYRADYTSIKDNNFSSIVYAAIHSGGTTSYWTTSYYTSNTVIRDNIIKNSNNYGIYLSYQSSSQVLYNEICGSVTQDIYCNSAESTITYLGNTCDNQLGCSGTPCSYPCP